jgi:hypothetical protein
MENLAPDLDPSQVKKYKDIPDCLWAASPCARDQQRTSGNFTSRKFRTHLGTDADMLAADTVSARYGSPWFGNVGSAVVSTEGPAQKKSMSGGVGVPAGAVEQNREPDQPEDMWGAAFRLLLLDKLIREAHNRSRVWGKGQPLHSRSPDCAPPHHGL